MPVEQTVDVDNIENEYREKTMRYIADRSCISLAYAARRAELLERDTYLDSITFGDCTYVMEINEKKGTIEVLTKFCLEDVQS